MDLHLLENNLSSAESYGDILAMMRREFGVLGVDEWIYIFQIVETFRTPPCICMATFAPEWLAHYMENSYFHVDPLMKHYVSSTLPLFWRADDDWSGYGPGALEFQQSIRDWGFWGGVCTPIFTKEGTRGFISFTSRDHGPETLEKAMKTAYLIRYFHHHVLRLWCLNHPGHTSLRAKLSPRETEILLLVADGLTSQEIADRLLMAKRTVDGHLVAVQSKLQAENRQQALCKAINLGLLQPGKDYTTLDVLWVL